MDLFSNFIGPTKVLISANTLQVSDYDRYDWTMFNEQEKKIRHQTVFQNEKQKAFTLGVSMALGSWNEVM